MTNTEKSAEFEKADGDDPVALAILTLLADAGPGKTISPAQAARTFAESQRQGNGPTDLWRRYLNAVRQQAIHLARSGRIEIIRKGKPVDPNNFKGVYRLRLKEGGCAPQKTASNIGGASPSAVAPRCSSALLWVGSPTQQCCHR